MMQDATAPAFNTLDDCAQFLAEQYQKGAAEQGPSRTVTCNITGKMSKVTANLQFQTGNSNFAQNNYQIKISGSNPEDLSDLKQQLATRGIRTIFVDVNYDGRDPATRSNPDWQGRVNFIQADSYVEEYSRSPSAPIPAGVAPSPQSANPVTIKAAGTYTRVVPGKPDLTCTNVRTEETATSSSEKLTFISDDQCADYIAEKYSTGKPTTITCTIAGSRRPITCKLNCDANKPIQLSDSSGMAMMALNQALTARGLRNASIAFSF